MNLDQLLERTIPIPESGCMLWESYVNGKGYGRTPYKGRLWLTHRLSYFLAYGDCPEDKFVCHKCDVPGCIRPDHLFLGTAADNNKDRDKKGRWQTLRGEAHGMAKITESDAIDIRQCLKDGIPYETISQAWGITESMVGMIKSGKSWKHLGGRIYTFHEYSDKELKELHEAAGQELASRAAFTAIQEILEPGTTHAIEIKDGQ